MPKIPATYERTVRIKASIDKVYEYFSKPALQEGQFTDLVSFELINDHKARRVLTPRKKKGVTFQPDLTVEYTGNGSDSVTWKTVAGNLETNGFAKLKKINDSETELRYSETMSPDIPINRILAKILKPIISKEIKSGISDYLDRAVKKIQS